MNNLLLVPHDFTNVGDAALKHAIFVAQKRNASIKVLHIVSDKSKINEAEQKLNELIQQLNLSELKIEPLVEIGSIFEEIGKIAENIGARLIIMGTHGARGMQKLFGSYAIKVIRSTKIPFLVVQETDPPTQIEHIAVPIDLSKESLQIINVASEIALTFGATIHILAEKQTSTDLDLQIKIRISLVKKEFEQKKINSEFHILSEGKHFYGKIMHYANTNDLDLIALSYYSSSLFPQFDGYAQSLITNEKRIPCLIADSKLLSKLYY